MILQSSSTLQIPVGGEAYKGSVLDCKKNYFELFDIPLSFNINSKTLKTNYNNLQFKYHPDRTNGSMIESSYINLGYSTLKDDIKRLRYIIELNGKSCDNFQLPASFLIEYYEYSDNDMTTEQIAELVNKITHEKNKLIQNVVNDLNLSEKNWDIVIENYTKITFLHNFVNRVQSL